MGAAIILATNAVALSGAAYNRSGEPDSTLELTERELHLPYDWTRDRDDSGLALRLNWRVLAPDSADRAGDGVLLGGRAVGAPVIRYYSDRSPAWLDSAKLTSMGFDLSKPLDTARGREYYRRALPKRIVLVLEMDGPAADTARERARASVTRQEALVRSSVGDDDVAGSLERIRTQLRLELVEGSRLFAVDAGSDRRALRASYPDRRRYALVPGAVRLRLVGPDSAPRLEGSVDGPVVREINVPRAFRPLFDSLRPRRPDGGRESSEPYSVTIAFGRRLEPWITAAARRR
jgi:hypothetical protein